MFRIRGKGLATLCSILLLGCSANGGIGWFSFGEYKHLRKAEELLRQKKYDLACEQYLKHIETRFEVSNRPDWENPYFYYLLIGDIKLRQENVAAALEAYEYAEKMGVENQLVSDRYRYLAGWYEKRGQLKEAIEILQKYRDRDPLLFDAVLDRIARELTFKEDKR